MRGPDADVTPCPRRRFLEGSVLRQLHDRHLLLAQTSREPVVTDRRNRTGVLFVCLGNICRSPTAEVVFREAAARAGLFHRIGIDSAGTGSWHVGNPPDHRAIEHAARRGYDLKPLRARQFARTDFDRFDWIFAMDRSVLRDLTLLRPPAFAGQLGLFMDLLPGMGTDDVPDPYDMGPEGFEVVLDLVIAGSDALAARLARNLAAPHDRSGRPGPAI